MDETSSESPPAMASPPRTFPDKGVVGMSHAEIVRGPEPALSVRGNYAAAAAMKVRLPGVTLRCDLRLAHKLRLMWLTFARSYPGCGRANGAIWRGLDVFVEIDRLHLYRLRHFTRRKRNELNVRDSG